MSEPINDGGPAFPMLGMTLRDYFAAQALAGILASQTEDGAFEYGKFDQPHSEWVPNTSYAIADAMLKAREVRP